MNDQSKQIGRANKMMVLMIRGVRARRQVDILIGLVPMFVHWRLRWQAHRGRIRHGIKLCSSIMGR